MLKADRIGLVIVLASLFAIATIAYLVFQYQHADKLADIRSQGVSLVRTVAGVPYRELVPGGQQAGVLQVLQQGTNEDELAYVGIVDRGGQVLHQVGAAGVILPATPMPAEPSAWLGEIQRQLPPDGQPVIEFHAPLLDDGELRGFVRIGYWYPKMGLQLVQLPFLAAVSLPVFLLVPLFYFLLRHEIRPVRDANREIGRLIEGESFRRLEVAATGELGDFMKGFNRFIEQAGQRIEGLEQDQKRLITSTKLMTYRKNRVETVLEALPEALMILDESGAIVFANRKLAAMFAVSPQTILTQAPQQWCDNPDVLQLLSRYGTGRQNRSFADTVRFNVDALSRRAVATRTYPLFAQNEQSTAIGTLIVFHDETQEALARQARTEFVSHLSHELKSPLNVLGLYSESLLSEAGKREEFRIEAANVIAEEVERLSTLINGLLNMTQIESGSLVPERSLVKLVDVCESAFEEARALASDRELNFVIDVPNEMNPVLVDKDLLRIAITNLLSNAVKYNKDGGEVRLTVEETDDAVQIRVADTGIGISDGDASQIFEKFFRSQDEKVQSIGGHGLGLALTRQIVELHYGTLTLDHERDAGVEFIINLWKETSAVKQAI